MVCSQLPEVLELGSPPHHPHRCRLQAVGRAGAAHLAAHQREMNRAEPQAAPSRCSLLAVSAWCIHLVSLEHGPRVRAHSRSRESGLAEGAHRTGQRRNSGPSRGGRAWAVTGWAGAERLSSGRHTYLEGLPVLALLTPLPQASPLPLLLLLPLQSSDMLLKADQCIFLVHV